MSTPNTQSSPTGDVAARILSFKAGQEFYHALYNIGPPSKRKTQELKQGPDYQEGTFFTPSPNDNDFRAHYDIINEVLEWLETGPEITPESARATNLRQKLEYIYKIPDYHFDEGYRTRAQAIVLSLDDLNWDTRQEEDAGDIPDDDDANAPSGAYVKIPHENDPIWGRNGPMAGIAYRKGQSGRKALMFNPDFAHFQGDFRFFGDQHQGRTLILGTWFPRQICAVYQGFHGHVRAGVHGDSNGCYSIVISGDGKYDKVGRDQGDTIYYSGPESAKSTKDRPAVDSPATKQMKINLSTKGTAHEKHVRVFRSTSAASDCAPAVGVRYDGLYRVEEVEQAVNQANGPYARFRLQRIAGQVPLESLANIPTAAQRAEFEKVGWNYTAARYDSLPK